MITKDQAEELKQQIISQIDNWGIDEEHKEKSKDYILSLDEIGLEQFLIKNNLIQPQDNKIQQESTQCVFCLILQGKIPCYKIAENSESIAILEIKPLSRGHTLVIPKEHEETKGMTKESFDLALVISRSIKKELNPKDVSISTSKMFGHTIINIIPHYGDETGERKEVKKEELEGLKNILFIKPKERPVVKESGEKTEYFLKRKIP